MITNDILTALMFSCGDDCLNGAQITTHLRKAVTAILPLATFWKSHLVCVDKYDQKWSWPIYNHKPWPHNFLKLTNSIYEPFCRVNTMFFLFKFILRE